MSKTITIKLKSAGNNVGPFTISDQYGNIIATDVTKNILINGISYIVDDTVTMITLTSTGNCTASVSKSLQDVTQSEYRNTKFEQTFNACLWRHLIDVVNYNYYYGFINPYIIEYPFTYQYQDQILQNIQDYTKVYEYTKDPTGVFNNTLRVQPNDKWFNEVVIYNDQQSTGLLKLEAKPLNNLQSYNSYPKFNNDSKTITYTKSDNFYQYNTFWNVVKDPNNFLFASSDESLSIDKIINQANMDYSTRSFRKDPIRAKDAKVRHMLTNSSIVHLVSQFILAPTQNSYK